MSASVPNGMRSSGISVGSVVSGQDGDRVGGVEAVALHYEHRPRLVGVVLTPSRGPKLAPPHPASPLLVAFITEPRDGVDEGLVLGCMGAGGGQC